MSQQNELTVEVVNRNKLGQISYSILSRKHASDSRNRALAPIEALVWRETSIKLNGEVIAFFDRLV